MDYPWKSEKPCRSWRSARVRNPTRSYLSRAIDALARARARGSGDTTRSDTEGNDDEVIKPGSAAILQLRILVSARHDNCRENLPPVPLFSEEERLGKRREILRIIARSLFDTSVRYYIARVNVIVIIASRANCVIFPLLALEISNPPPLVWKRNTRRNVRPFQAGTGASRRRIAR